MKLLYTILFFLILNSLSAQMRGFGPKAADQQQQIEQLLLEIPTSDRFREHLEVMTREPHPAGSAANKAVADYIDRIMTEAGWQVTQHPYDVYLPTGPGRIEVALVTPIRRPLNNQEYIIPEDPYSAQDIGPGWNSYSGSGDVTAEVVYVNYGTKEDFEKLAELGVSVKGKIAIARYGGNFRGYKAKFAEAAGAAGLIIYTDPEDSGYMRGLSYPEGSYFSESTIQRGSVLTLDYTGDPLTPFEPALPLDGAVQVARLDPATVAFHTIPVTPLPYGSAQEILSRMRGQVVPQAWQGGLPFTYRLEGGADLRVRLMVDQPKDFVRVQNVVGTLEGSTYPDEWIIAGSHYDAWVHGATDPNSGTAMLLCLAEALGQLAQQGNVPQRTIKIAHWDAEEHGILASTEWVEQYREELDQKAIAYFNADGACSGLNFGAASAPSLKGLLVESTKVVPYPGKGQSVYEHWVENAKDKSKGPNIGNLGGGSDHLGFYAHLGIPSLGAGMRGPTLYHSAYDNFHWYSTLGDTAFISGPTVAKVFGVMALRLANADILPLDIARYATDLSAHVKTAEQEIQSYQPGYQLSNLHTEVERLAKAAEKLEATYRKQVKSGKLTAAQRDRANPILLRLDRAFIDEEGMAYGKWFRSLYASSDPYSGYASWMLPGLRYEASLRSTANLLALERRYLAAFKRLRKDIEELNRILD